MTSTHPRPPNGKPPWIKRIGTWLGSLVAISIALASPGSMDSRLAHNPTPPWVNPPGEYRPIKPATHPLAIPTARIDEVAQPQPPLPIPSLFFDQASPRSFTALIAGLGEFSPLVRVDPNDEKTPIPNFNWVDHPVSQNLNPLPPPNTTYGVRAQVLQQGGDKGGYEQRQFPSGVNPWLGGILQMVLTITLLVKAGLRPKVLLALVGVLRQRLDLQRISEEEFATSLG